MRKIIVASVNVKLVSALEKMLALRYSEKPLVFRSETELMPALKTEKSPLLILGPLKDQTAIYLAKSVPSDWDVILLLPSSAPIPYYVSNIVSINLPINRMELLETVDTLVRNYGDTSKKSVSKKHERTDEENDIIEQAKNIIIQKRGISEPDAHHLLQKIAMNMGISMVESAKRFLD